MLPLESISFIHIYIHKSNVYIPELKVMLYSQNKYEIITLSCG